MKNRKYKLIKELKYAKEQFKDDILHQFNYLLSSEKIAQSEHYTTKKLSEDELNFSFSYDGVTFHIANVVIEESSRTVKLFVDDKLFSFINYRVSRTQGINLLLIMTDLFIIDRESFGSDKFYKYNSSRQFYPANFGRRGIKITNNIIDYVFGHVWIRYSGDLTYNFVHPTEEESPLRQTDMKRNMISHPEKELIKIRQGSESGSGK